MKILIYLFFFIGCLSATSISVIKLKDESKSIIHFSLVSKQSFKCKIFSDSNLKDNIYCNITNDNNISKSEKFDFFSFKIKENSILIIPEVNYKLFTDDIEIFDKSLFDNKKSYKKLDIIFYKNSPEYFQYKSITNNLNFDIKYTDNTDLYIDVLNDDLNPVVSLKDVTKINFIKKLYRKKDYYSVITKADRELKNNNIYSSEILLYKIRALDKLLEDKTEVEYSYDNLESACNEFIERFPSNKNLTEVLYYKSKSLYARGKYNNANTIVNRLNKNFPNDFFSEKASILKAKNLFFRNKMKNISYKILKDVLYNTKFVENALESAYLLTGNYLKDRDIKQAKIFLEKILKYNKEYLLKDYKKSYEYAKKFADLKDYVSAVKIAEVLNKSRSSEEILKDLAFWQDKANMKEKAYKDYKEYLEKYPDGKYIQFVREKMDKVLLDVNDTNNSKKLKDIDKVIEKYANEPIYKKALLEKVKLLYKNKKYNEILKISDKLKDINETSYVEKSAQKLVYDYLDKQDCTRAVNIVNSYKVPISSTKLYKLTKCYYALARYKDSLDLSKKFIQSKSFNENIDWYFLAIKSAAKLRDWTTVIKLYEELLKIKGDRDIAKDIYHDVFYSYIGLKYISKALDIVSIVEKKYPNDPKLLDIYYSLIKYYKNNKVDLSIVLYAKKLLKLQKKLKVQTYSPIVDIMLIKSLKNLNKYKEALSYFADAYLSKNINDIQKAQLLYLAGELSIKNNNIKQAREFFIKCGTDVKSRMWQKLCSESLKLIEDR